MLPHGRDELLRLADRCTVTALGQVNGWLVDVWQMDEEDVDAAIALYDAVLLGGADDAIVALLEEAGLDLDALLADADATRDAITRSDLTELTAAASLIADPGCDIDCIHMPNVPKMSRRKSDSGIDIFVAALEDGPDEELNPGEHLTIVSVKHTVLNSTAGMRAKIAKSLSSEELTGPYLAQQLRVLHGRLVQEGSAPEVARRVYLFIRDFPDEDCVSLVAVGAAEPDLADNFRHHIGLLPEVDRTNYAARMILMPGLRTVHERCS